MRVAGSRNVVEGGMESGDTAAKGKPPKLLQQSGGTPRSEKRRLHLQTV